MKRNFKLKSFGASTRLITAVICLCVLQPTVALTFAENNLRFRTEGKNAIVTGYYGIDPIIEIPAYVRDDIYTVTKIDPAAFQGNYHMEEVLIPMTITAIGDEAFKECSKLKRITIPSSVVSLGTNSLFGGCRQLESVTFRCNIKEFGEYCFGNCESLSSIDIPKTVISIGKRAFYNTALKTIKIHDAVETIAPEAFYMCHGLETVEIGCSVNRIGQYAFGGTSIKNIYYNATDCRPCEEEGYSLGFPTSVENIIIGENVNSIPEYAFYRCNGMKTLVIPDGLKTIGKRAFGECKELKTVTIGRSVTEIGEGAFFACDNLKEVYFNAEECQTSGLHRLGWLYQLEKLPFTRSIENIVIGESVKKIPDYAFPLCQITNLEIPSSVTDIGDYAFYSCSKINSLSMSPSLKTIGSSAFAEIYDLTKLTIPEGVESIGDEAFSNCVNLTDVDFEAMNCKSSGRNAFTTVETLTIGSKVTKVPVNTFSGCNGMKELNYKAENLSMGLNQWSEAVYPETIEHIIIDKGVRTISGFVFWGCKNTNVIQFNAEDCKIVYNPSGLLWDFTPFEKIGHFIIGDNVNSIPDNLCNSAEGVYEVTVGASVEQVGSHAFVGCTKLRRITFLGTPSKSGQGAFEYSDELISVGIVNAHDWAVSQWFGSPFFSTHARLIVNGQWISNLGLYLPGQTVNTAFRGAAIDKLRIQAREVPNFGFYECTLKSVCLELESIGSNAFKCENLSEVYSMTATPPDAPDDTFLPKCYSRGTLYVPVGSREKYKNAIKCWYQFENIIETDFADIDNRFRPDNAEECAGINDIVVSESTENDNVRVYTLGGIMVGSSLDGLVPGVYIVRSGDKVSKHIVK